MNLENRERDMDYHITEELKLAIEQNKVIAFDFFDTIVYRNVSPKHVHYMWANRMINFFELDLKVEKLVKIKFQSMRLAKFNNLRHGYDKEYDYKQMSSILYNRIKPNVDIIEFYEKSMLIEESIEKEVISISTDFLDIFKLCNLLKKKIIIISDFYLPSRVLKNILQEHKIEIDVKDIYVSCDFKRTKDSGNLYKEVIKSLKIDPKEMLMIGDNQKSDFENSKKNGCNGYWHKCDEQIQFYKKFHDDIETITKDASDLYNRDWIQNRNEPYSYLTFALFPFIEQLYCKLIKDGKKDVFFFSSEGELYKKLFDDYQMIANNGVKKINTFYMCVSRHSTLLPSIFGMEKKYFEKIYQNYPDMKLYHFLKNLGLENNSELREEFKNELDKDETISDFENSQVFDKLLSSVIFERECMKLANEQRTNFIGYVDNFGVDIKTSGLNIVDIGYNGTTQDNIYKIYNSEVNITGYYMMLYTEKVKNPCSKKVGILYDENLEDKSKKDVIAYNSSVIEVILRASHGSIDSYLARDNSYFPVYETTNPQVYTNIIKPIQDLIIIHFNEITKIFCKINYSKADYYKDFTRMYKKFILSPSNEEMDIYISIPFEDNFAIYKKLEDNIVKNELNPIKNLISIVMSRGKILRKQQTNWVAVAFYKLNLNFINKILYYFSSLSLKLFFTMEKMKLRKRLKNKQL